MGIVPNFEDSDFRVEEEYDSQSPDTSVKDCAMCTVYKEKLEKCKKELEEARGLYFCVFKIFKPQLESLALNLRI